MAFDEDLAGRVRALVAHEPGFEEKRMFGGAAMMLHGNMAVVVHSGFRNQGRGGIMVRVDPAGSESLLAEPGVEATIMRGRALRGWLSVEPSACGSDEALRTWVGRGVTYTKSLPPR